MGRRAGLPQSRRRVVAPRLRVYAGAELFLLAGAVLLSVAVAIDGEPLPGDLALTRRAQDLPAFHTTARAFRWGMGTEGVLVAGAGFAAGLWLWRRRREAGVLVLALLVLRLVQPLLKDIVDRERPSEALVDRRAGFSSESFPSGHMMSAVVLCGILMAIVCILPLGRGTQWVLAAALAVVVGLNGLSTVYMGVHWPSDLLGGLLLGLAIVIPAAWAMRRGADQADSPPREAVS